MARVVRRSVLKKPRVMDGSGKKSFGEGSLMMFKGIYINASDPGRGRFVATPDCMIQDPKVETLSTKNSAEVSE